MKKLVSLLLALVMILSLSAVVFAEGTNYEDMETVTITKHYEATNAGTTSPAETFNFTIEATNVSDAADGVTVENMPVPTIGSVTYVAGDAGKTNPEDETNNPKDKDITITLPRYTSVGIYTYTIHETAGDTAGVTYYGNDIRLKVTVIEQDGKVRVAAVHTEENFNGTEEAGTKKNEITNTYSAGSLSVKKNVTGLLGDKEKEFTVHVTFTAPANKTVKEAISYVEDGETKTIATTDWENGVASVNIALKHDETITFTNIPYEVTYTVAENDYTSAAEGGYDAASYNTTDDDNKINTASETVTITNNKDGNVDTGVVLDSLPYILVLTIAVAGVAVLFVKKRHEA